LGTNNTAVFWASTSEILVGARHPAAIKAWNPANDTVNEFPLNSDPPEPVFWFLPQSRTILITHTNSGSNSLTFSGWDALSRRAVASYTIPAGFGNPEFSVDGRLMAMHKNGIVSVRNVATGEEVYSLTHAYGVQGMAFFPDGKRLATASTHAPVVKVLDLATGRELVSFRGHNLVLSRIVVSPDGQRLATSTIGQEPIKIWDTTSWEETASLEVPGGVVDAAAFLSDGNTLAGFDPRQGVLHLWRAPSWDEINAAEAKKSELKQP
jgi:WD40 repeat protein